MSITGNGGLLELARSPPAARRNSRSHACQTWLGRQDCYVPLFGHAQFPHARDCQASTEVGVKHQPKLCKASAEALSSSITRITTFEWLGREDSNLESTWNALRLQLRSLGAVTEQILSPRPDEGIDLGDAESVTGSGRVASGDMRCGPASRCGPGRTPMRVNGNRRGRGRSMRSRSRRAYSRPWCCCRC